MSTLPLSPQVFAILRGLIEEKLGLSYGLDDRDFIAERAGVRAVDRGFDSLLDYYYFLRYDDRDAEELHALADALVVNETYFFRELDQLEALVGSIIAPRVAKGDRMRVWSAACSTGEEPLTLAMLLDERGLLSKVDILATDISARVLARAREGRYGPRSLRLPSKPELLSRWTYREGDATVVRKTLVDKIDFRKVNLLDDEAIGSLAEFDVILCRNVLIYFAENTVRHVIESLTKRLRPGGVLFVGVSESLLRFGTSLQCEEHRGSFCYKKPA